MNLYVTFCLPIRFPDLTSKVHSRWPSNAWKYSLISIFCLFSLMLKMCGIYIYLADFLPLQWNVLNNMVGNQKVSQNGKGWAFWFSTVRKTYFPQRGTDVCIFWLWFLKFQGRGQWNLFLYPVIVLFFLKISLQLASFHTRYGSSRQWSWCHISNHLRV